MKCKNCQLPISTETKFCDNCGAKVVKARITFISLITELFSNVFGLDSKYFYTLKKLMLAPQDVLTEYLSGVRKRYVNPFAYLAVGAGLSLIVFNFFSKDFIKVNTSFNKIQNPELYTLAKADSTAYLHLDKEAILKFKQKQVSAKRQIKFQQNYTKFMLQYFNLLAFLFLPIYAFISKFTYQKKHNYGEHIVINAYLQGTTMYFSIIAFLMSLLIHPLIYMGSMVIYIIYYLYTFSKLYKHSIKKSILKFFRFIGVLCIPVLIVFVFTVIIGFFIKII